MSNAETRRQNRLGVRRAAAYTACERCVLVYDALAECAGPKGRAFPSLGRLVEVTGVGRDAVRSALTNLQTVGLIADTGDRAGPTGRTVVWQIVEVPAETLRDRLESHDYTHRKRRPLSGRLANPAVAGRGAPAEVWPDENRPPPDWAADREGDG